MSALARGVPPSTAGSTGPTYVAPSSVADVVTAMAAGARVVAGGTDLVVGSRQGKWNLPDQLVAIHRVDALRGMREAAGGGLSIGALVSHGEVAASPVIRERYTALADASSIVGSHATRHVGTVGGNLVNASPAAEISGPLIGLGASVVLESSGGRREVPVEEFFSGPGQTVARPDELLVSVSVPAPAARSASCYARLEYRRQMEIAVVGATAVVTLDDAGRIASARIAITALAPTVRRVPEAEALLVGSDGSRAVAEQAGQAAAAACQPIDDVRAPAGYRRAMAAVITRRVILAALARARGETVAIPASATLHGAV